MKVQGLEEVAFSGGRIVASRGVQALREKGLDVHYLLQRHFLGDDGCVSEADHKSNVAARKPHIVYAMNERAGDSDKWDRVFSSYETQLGKVWIITEGDRSYTTVLLPSEY
jgi:hypothetical protein